MPAHVVEGVMFLPAPNGDRLVDELRMMVAGQAVLSEGKKA
jgi:hypothetical protein